MTTLTVHPVSEDQETAIKLFLDALHVDYKPNDESNDTSYLLSSEANADHLQKSIADEQQGKVTKLSLGDI